LPFRILGPGILSEIAMFRQWMRKPMSSMFPFAIGSRLEQAVRFHE